MIPRTGANKPGGERARGRKSHAANRLGGETAKGRISHNSFSLLRFVVNFLHTMLETICARNPQQIEQLQENRNTLYNNLCQEVVQPFVQQFSNKVKWWSLSLLEYFSTVLVAVLSVLHLLTCGMLKACVRASHDEQTFCTHAVK